MKQDVDVIKRVEQRGDEAQTSSAVLHNMPAALRSFLVPTFAAIRTRGGAVTALYWEGPSTTALSPVDPDLLAQVREWLADYFSGHFRPVSFPLVWEGTPFQQRLGQQLAAIPPGQTLSYGALAQRLQSSPRAVGRGVGSNPLPLLLPCHRVVAANGLGGFSAPGGITTKQWLLSWEQRHGQEGPRKDAVKTAGER
ncbi:MAG: methylated-DNA--[protein]-cysteine S-methyltransferase [Magnetococcales bacterium]|nr:methylated-DNA--[protein]-cysteine S-methyltransferase [Magnetococcales bacterium]